MEANNGMIRRIYSLRFALFVCECHVCAVFLWNPKEVTGTAGLKGYRQL